MKDIICPFCGQKDIHKCTIYNPKDKSNPELRYHCNICNNNWDNFVEIKNDYDCYWCANYKSMLKGEDLTKSSFVILITAGADVNKPPQGIDPIYCPFCGKKMEGI